MIQGREEEEGKRKKEERREEKIVIREEGANGRRIKEREGKERKR